MAEPALHKELLHKESRIPWLPPQAPGVLTPWVYSTPFTYPPPAECRGHPTVYPGCSSQGNSPPKVRGRGLRPALASAAPATRGCGHC